MQPNEQQLANREAWFVALRSGTFQQGTGQLREIYGAQGYCCLGVDADIAGRLVLDECEPGGGPESDCRCYFFIENDGQKGSPEWPSVDWFAARHGILQTQAHTLQSQCAMWNDQERKSFSDIADLVASEFAHYDKVNAELK